jgi:hypothetical protein
MSILTSLATVAPHQLKFVFLSHQSLLSTFQCLSQAPVNLKKIQKNN